MEMMVPPDQAMSLYQGPALIFLILNLGFSALFAILFLQSGIDKITDRKGNLDWLTGHFAKSPLASMVPLLLSILTFTEIAAGAAALAGGIIFVISGNPILLFWAEILCMANLIFLFFGQRMAKDYAGAAGIVPYFIAVVLGLFVAWSSTSMYVFSNLYLDL